jgi:aminopeptidase-like protein
LHIVNYSAPISQKMSWSELEPHLHTLPEKPEAIPYLTTYYKERWGFCLSHNQYSSLPHEGEYTVVVDSTLSDGAITLGHLVLPGTSDEEIFFSSYLCHPSMANNELSGPLALAFLYSQIASIQNRKYTYRFIIVPETIGVIAYLSFFGEHMKRCTHSGYVLTCLGDSGTYNYKRSKRSNSIADKAAEHVLKYQDEKYAIREFSVGGSDERQYCSPGYNMPVGSLMRSVYHEFPEYHTSLDNKDFLSFKHLEKTIVTYTKIVEVFEGNLRYKGTVQYGEPMLGKHGMYPSSSTPDVNRMEVMKLMHFLTYADGQTSLLEIAEKMDLPIQEFIEVAKKCVEKGLVTIEQ